MRGWSGRWSGCGWETGGGVLLLLALVRQVSGLLPGFEVSLWSLLVFCMAFQPDRVRMLLNCLEFMVALL